MPRWRHWHGWVIKLVSVCVNYTCTGAEQEGDINDGNAGQAAVAPSQQAPSFADSPKGDVNGMDLWEQAVEQRAGARDGH